MRRARLVTARAAALGLGLWLALGGALPLAADPHPNIAGGFSPEKSFAIGDVDHVNLFNGNVVVTIPLGGNYPVAGGLSYDLTLVHNGNPWFFEQRTDTTTGQTYTQAEPTPCSNAGLGWRVSFGEIDPPCSSTDIGNPIYEDASGADHLFYPALHAGEAVDGSSTHTMYTADGTYLRMQTVAGGDLEIDFPDGSIHHFHHLPADGMSSRQRLTEIRDAFGNRMDVDYSVPGQWAITDQPLGAVAATRTHRVYFRGDLPGYPQTVDHVELAGFGGAVSTYGFTYTTGLIARACPNNDILSYGVNVPFLTGVTLPDGSAYTMAASDYSMPAPPAAYPQTTTTCATGAGDLLGLQLPTLGRVEWTYTTYKFPAANTPWRSKNQGVATRTTKNEQGAVLGTWTYTTSLPVGETHQLVNSVTNPLGQRTDHYFSVALDNSIAGWSGCDYGQPFTRNVSVGGTAPLFLSSQTFRTSGALFRSEYARYERDVAGLCAGDAATFNNRVAKTRTVYEDDGGTYAETDLSDFDGLGHYRTATTAGTFPAGNVRTHVTDFNPANGTYTVDPDTNAQSGNFTPLAPTAKWILGSSSYRYDQENGVTGSYVETCYGATTGSLARQRVHQQAGAGESAVDTVTAYTYDTQGKLTAETSYGGDVQKGIATAGICSLNPGAGLPAAPEYEVDYGYQYGVRSSARSLGASFYSLDQQIDSSTGLARSSTDTTGVLTTTYGYDLMGRVTSVQPAQGAKTVYAYTRANPATRALAGVDIQRQGGGGAALAEQQLVFDALGREYRATQKLADGSFNVRETLYDGAGNRASVSELQAGNAVQKTSFLYYDPAGRATLIRPADSTSANGFAHDVKVAYGGNRLVTRTVPVGQSLASGAVVESPAVTTELYDRQGRLYQVTEPSGASGANVTTTYGYDVGNRLSSVATASAGVTQTRTFTYDPRGFLLAETHPEKGVAGNGTVTYSLYDSRGHAGRKIDGPNDLTYQYDGAERLTIVRASGTPFSACNQLSGPRCLKSFTYAIQNGSGDYKNGKLFQSIRYNYPILGGTPYQAFITETYHYGGVDGRVSQRDMQLTFALNGQPPAPSESFTESFAYDLLGDTGSITYPSCTFSACAGKDVPRTVSFGHTNGFLTAVTGTATTLGGMPSASTYASAIAYWPNLMVAQVTHGNGVVDTQANDPNAMRRPLSIASTINNGQTTLWKTDGYAYDGAGNITQIGAGRFLYDGVSRLTSGSLVLGTLDSGAAASQTYAYDAFGNIQSIGGTTARNTPTNSATNRLSGAASYDAAGNLTAWNGATYEYDALNQMKHYISGSEEWLYMYDADDERLWSYKPGVPGVSSRFDRWTIRDLAGKVLRTYEASGYNWTGSDVEDSVYRDGLLLAAELPNTGATHHFHLDHLGTPRLITDQNRAQVAYHVYYPFGEEATPFNQDAERMKFTGHERDLASAAGAGDDLDYMHARHESPVTGRFLVADQDGFLSLQFGDDQERARFKGFIVEPQVWNLYVYAIGNPLKYTDQNGSSAELAVATSLSFVEEGAATLSTATGPVAVALGAGLGIGTLINRIPGVSQGIQEAFGRVLDSIYLAENNKHTTKVISGLVASAARELGKIGSAGGPERDPDFKHHKEEVRAALQRAYELAKRLPGKSQDAALRAIQELATRAGVIVK